MTSLAYFHTDFRDEAVEASTAALRQLRLSPDQPDLTIAGCSVCVPANGDPATHRKVIARLLKIQYLLMVSAIAAGGALIFYSRSSSSALPPEMRIPLLYSGIVLAVLGWLAMCSAVDLENVWTRVLLRRFDAPVPGFQPKEKPIVIRIEDPLTCQKIKLVGEDRGLLYCDANRRLIVIEGLFYRYVLWGRDLSPSTTHETAVSRYVMLSCAIAGSDKVLTLAISSNSALAIIKRQLSGGVSRAELTRIIEQTLGTVLG